MRAPHFPRLSSSGCRSPRRWARPRGLPEIPDHEVKRVMDTLQRAVPIPQREIIVRRGLRRQAFGQGAPLATGLQNVENPVHHLAAAPAAPWPAGSAARSAPTRHRSNRSDSERSCARRGLGSRASTSATSCLANRWPKRNHKRFQRINFFPDRHLDPRCPRKRTSGRRSLYVCS